MTFLLTPGQTHDITQAGPLLKGLAADQVIADKGYDGDQVLQTIRDQVLQIIRDQVLQTCPRLNQPGTSNMQQALEGSSLETIRHMVASGIGITVLPSTAADAKSATSNLLAVRPFAAPQPTRRVALAWRKSFPRPQSVEALRLAILGCKLPGVTSLPGAPAIDG